MKFTKTMFVGMYKNKPTETYYSDQDMFVALDSYSGGYPTRVDFTRAHGFKTKEECEKYCLMSENEIEPVVINITAEVSK